MSKPTLLLLANDNDNSEPSEKIPSSIQSPASPVYLPPSKPSYPLRTMIASIFSKRVPQFNDLPKELRLLIWEAALPDGRVHELHPCTTLLENGKMMFRSNHSKPPIILSVCRESRVIALQHYQLMNYDAPTGAKGIRKFYFSPRNDTLFLNTLMGLYMAFMLLESETELDSPLGRGAMMGWQNTRFRTSVWPGENGTSLQPLNASMESLDRLQKPIIQFTKMEYASRDEEENTSIGLPLVEVVSVNRKRYLRGDMRYGFRKTCSKLHVRPPTFLLRL
ncbi:hypothetical protein BJ878DRAFT_418380 [Calycina marina]|uniref:2EXR domain-containing protein n=1 Tax=Calycina marina TaxID=1763456 RepID=A0A9P7Z567_9HELO|nr:hypothetical protein BJ878DRAFT_418380 [Calycina marina]